METIIKCLEYFGITPENAGKYFMFVSFFIGSMYYLLKKQLAPMKENIKEVNKSINHIEKYLIRISEYWRTKQPKSFTAIYKQLEEKASPVKSTGLGEKILKESGLKKVIDDNKERFIKKIELLKSKTAYDVENNAFDVLFEESSNDSFNVIKNWLYENPEYEYNNNVKFIVDLTMVVRIGRIYLRDLYLDKHKELIKK